MAERFPFVQKWFVFVQAGKKIIEMQVVMDIMWRLGKMGSFFGRRQTAEGRKKYKRQKVVEKKTGVEQES